MSEAVRHPRREIPWGPIAIVAAGLAFVAVGVFLSFGSDGGFMYDSVWYYADQDGEDLAWTTEAIRANRAILTCASTFTIFGLALVALGFLLPRAE